MMAFLYPLSISPISLIIVILDFLFNSIESNDSDLDDSNSSFCIALSICVS